jgi:hypothetical protein
LRAFRNKAGGWTCITAAGESVELRTASTLLIWEALTEGTRFDELLAELGRAFPDEPRHRLAADLAAFLGELERGGLVHRSPDPSRPEALRPPSTVPDRAGQPGVARGGPTC